MYRIAAPVGAIVLIGAAMLFAIPANAQLRETSVGGQGALANGDAAPGLTIVDVEAALAVIEADGAIGDAEKNQLRPKYEQAIEALKKATGFAAQTADYRDALQTASTAAAGLRKAIGKLPSAEDAAQVRAASDSEELQKDIESRRAALDGLNAELLSTSNELARARGRPTEISVRLPEVQRQLSDINRQLASPEVAVDVDSSDRVAERTRLEAIRSSLLGELEMLNQEQASQGLRENVLLARQELQQRQIENDTAALNVLRGLLDRRLSSEARRFSQRAAAAMTAITALPETDEKALALGAEVQALAVQFGDAVENLRQATDTHERIADKREQLRSDYENIQEQLTLGGSGGAMAQVLFDLDDRLLNTDVLNLSLPTLAETRMKAHRVEQQLRGQEGLQQQFAEHSTGAVAQLVTLRREVLERLRTQYGNLNLALARLENARSTFLTQAREIHGSIREELVWLRSSPPVGLETLTNIPGSLGWLFQRAHWQEFGQALWWTIARMPVRSVGILLVVGALLLTRRRIVAELKRTGMQIRRTSTDRYAYSVEALVCTLLLAAPVPLLIGFGGWAMGQKPELSGALQNIARGLQVSGWIMLGTGLIRLVCRPGGLGTAHFRWKEEHLARLRRAIRRFAAVYIPAFLLTSGYYFHGDVTQFLDSAGRVSFMLAHAWAALVVWRLFRGADGVLATLVRESPNRLVTRWRRFWLPLLLAIPFVLVLLAALGYMFTAIELSLGFLVTLALIAGGCVSYGLALRWFTMKQRKLALAEALERRRARQEAAASEEEPSEATGEVVSVDPEEEEELDLDLIGDQTTSLLRLLFGLAIAIAILAYWSGTFPLIPVLSSITIPLTGGLTLLRLTNAVLILIVAYVIIQNLPGLLELAVLRATTIDPGTRCAITSLCQYGVIAIGLVVLFNVLQVDWAKFGWMAAAVSVGLGFGLQEVVANFVCGLILLFERPIRVGDVVTLEGTTGKVTKIHLRATTIMDWNREELVVPNKTLITSPLTNLTLSSPLNRILLPVGVAYGSDTEAARKILLDVAGEHSMVLEEPPPVAAFEQFADSSLNLVLRAFLPDRDNRIGVITELHTEIDKRLAEAGIEIAFPQRDIHIRSGSNDDRLADSGGAEDEVPSDCVDDKKTSS